MRKLSCRKSICSVFLLGTAAATPALAQTLTTLVNFNLTNGANPYAPLVQATDGNLYGTASAGGASTACFGGGCGTIFRVTPAGTLTTIYSFCTQANCADGSYPTAGLIQAATGAFYGTSEQGGANSYGTVFRITSAGALMTLYSFCARTNCADGSNPFAGLLQANGNLYGTTYMGGVNLDGTIFKLTSGGALTTLYSFQGPSGGATPSASLVQGTGGNFYGITEFGGANNTCPPYNGCGTVFKITPGGALTTLHSFNGIDGSRPYAGLVAATDGNLYGTTEEGGANNHGTVFKISSSGTLRTLHNFNVTDGSGPYGGLVQATDGQFYGTTQFGGSSTACSGGCGTLFKITSSGALISLYSFCAKASCTDGTAPLAALMQATDGNFYGTSYGGGANGDGTIFSFSTGLGPFVKTLPTSGKVGAQVSILGTNLTGATSVTFNGAPAAFTVVSASQITTTVPAGATTGKVQVVTPGGRLVSNVAFRVLP